ncbi:MAG TPA: hypothetical protein VMP01_02060 [Pirellulaceae bacterium]|nr:hypothetical protein [Pirellulaceae bacterium]
MKFWTLAVAAAFALLATDAAMARGRHGCPGGNCYVGGAVQAPVQKWAAETSPSDAGKQAAAEAAPAAEAPLAVAPTTQRTRRFASFRLGRRN